MPNLKTERLILRPWREADLAPFRAMNADTRVRAYFAELLTAAQSDASALRMNAHIEAHGYGFWALEAPGIADFIGFTGITTPGFDPPFPCIEIGWRLAAEHWGKRYATEAARAALSHGLWALGFDDVVACTVPTNLPSRAVMERLGMRHLPEHDFDHPEVAAGHPLSRHMLYHLTKANWIAKS